MNPHIVIAPDSFKGSLTASAAAEAIAAGVRDVLPAATLTLIPLADGGEGTMAVIHTALGGTWQTMRAANPAGTPIESRFLRTTDPQGRATAVIETADTAGLTLIPEDQRAAGTATTRGLGEQLQAALDAGADRIIIGLGGSATTDGGVGALTALGARCRDAQGNDLGSAVGAFSEGMSVDLSGLDPRWQEVSIELAADVDNPLCGPNGAVAVFGPQKGLSATDIPVRDAQLAALGRALLTATHRPESDLTLPGGGAAGGLGFGLMVGLGARMTPGAPLINELAGLPQALAQADLVITGEGSVDAQTRQGKTPWGVATAAAAAAVPCAALAGAVADREALLSDDPTQRGFVALAGITPAGMDLATAMQPEQAAANLRAAAARLIEELVAKD